MLVIAFRWFVAMELAKEETLMNLRRVRTRSLPAPGAEALESRSLLAVAGRSIVLDPVKTIDPIWFERLNLGQIERETATLDWHGQTAEVRSDTWIIQSQIANNVARSPHELADRLQAQAPFALEPVSGLGMTGSLLVRTPGVEPRLVLDWFSSRPDIAWIEPDFVVHAFLTPNDTNYSTLWGLNNNAQIGGIVDADIDAPQAWDITTGGLTANAPVVVGVIDTGVDYNHQDLISNMWKNLGEVRNNNLDDDGNGLVDDYYGYDFYNHDSNPMDDHNHGTHVSGTIAALGNNSKGIVGVNWKAKIMALKFIGVNGTGETSGAISAINYATMMKQRGVNIRLTNNSWGDDGFSESLKTAIDNSGAADMLFVAAAGNSGNNSDVNPLYPAAYDSPNLISVAASNLEDELAGFSNRGVQTVDLAAPGVSVLSTVVGNNYSGFSGTSMAAPHVVGVASLLWDRSPNSSYEQVKAALLQGVDRLPVLQGQVLTGGRLNARMSLELIAPLSLKKEFRQSLATTGTQGVPVSLFGDDRAQAVSLVRDVDGNYVLLWKANTDANGFGSLIGRRFSPAGAALTSEFVISASNVRSFDAAVDEAGNIVVVYDEPVGNATISIKRYTSKWVLLSQSQANAPGSIAQDPRITMGAGVNAPFTVGWSAYDGTGWDAVARRYQGSGTAIDASAFSIHQSASGDQRLASLATTPDGGFLAVWNQDGFVGANQINASGVDALGDLTIANAGSWASPDALAMDPDGRFAVALQQNNGGQHDLIFKQYNATGQATGEWTLANGSFDQKHAQLGRDSMGNHVAVWSSLNEDGNSWGVYARRFGADPISEPQGGQSYRITTSTTGAQGLPALAVGADGDFVVSWAGNGSGDAEGVWAALFTPPRAAQQEYRVNQKATGVQSSNHPPSVAVDAKGNYLIVYPNAPDINNNAEFYTQRYSAVGTPLGSPVKVASKSQMVTAAMDALGNYVIVRDGSGAGDTSGIFARRYNDQGVAQGTEFLVNVQTAGVQNKPTVAMNAAGDFVVAWSDSTQSGNYRGVYARRFTKLGVARDASDLLVNPTFPLDASTTSSVAVALDNGGHSIFAWTSTDANSDSNVIYRRFNNSGTPTISETSISGNATDRSQRIGVGGIAVSETGQFALAWQDLGRDGDNSGIFAQRFLTQGAANGADFAVNVTTTGSQTRPVVGMNYWGDLAFAWETGDTASHSDIITRSFPATGSPSDESIVNTTTTGIQRAPGLGIARNGASIYAWIGEGRSDSIGVFAKRSGAGWSIPDESNQGSGDSAGFGLLGKNQGKNGEFREDFSSEKIQPQDWNRYVGLAAWQAANPSGSPILFKRRSR